MKHPRRVATTAAIGVIMLGTASVAVASIPSSNGVIHGCYAKAGPPFLSPPAGTLRVIDSPSQNCTANETALTWNQTGPQGPQGTQCPVGPAASRLFPLLGCAAVASVHYRGESPIPWAVVGQVSATQISVQTLAATGSVDAGFDLIVMR